MMDNRDKGPLKLQSQDSTTMFINRIAALEQKLTATEGKLADVTRERDELQGLPLAERQRITVQTKLLEQLADLNRALAAARQALQKIKELKDVSEGYDYRAINAHGIAVAALDATETGEQAE